MAHRLLVLALERVVVTDNAARLGTVLVHLVGLGLGLGLGLDAARLGAVLVHLHAVSSKY